VNVSTLSIGDELMFGEVIDTNAATIAARLYACGLKVTRHLTVGDTEADIAVAIQSLAAASDAVIITGGLGPTVDDITAQAAARATGDCLVLNDQALAHLRGFAGKLGGPLHPQNERQALLPAAATIIPNPTGTACGFILIRGGCSLFFLPGVPGEMMRMLDETVIPALRHQLSGERCLRTGVLKVFGPSEAEVDALLAGLADPGAGVTLAYGVAFPEIFVKIRVEGESEEAVAELLTRTRERVRRKLDGFVYAEDDETMDSVVAGLFRQKAITLSLAESCTGGLVAKRITDVPGSSAYFLAGAVTYANTAKSGVLGVSPKLLAERGAVSAEVAMAMAQGVRRLSGSDIALAVTGIAGPDGGTPDKPVGMVYIAMDTRAGCQAKAYHFHGNRAEIRTITAFMAMDRLRRYLLSL
jgi:nicotinamide-nucleotide amidase